MLKTIFTSQFLFQINRVQVEPIDKLFLFLGLVALIIAGILKLAQKFALSPIDAKLRGKLFGPFLFLGLAQIVWYGARVQLVRFFGSHFLAILLLLIFLVWLGALIFRGIKTYQTDKLQWEKEQVKIKYLPK